MVRLGPKIPEIIIKTSIPSKSPFRQQKEFQRVLSLPFSLGYNPISHAYE